MDTDEKGLSRITENLPALPRFSDNTQRRAGGNIIKFIAALLALTLIARGTSGATLARVDVASPSRGEIVDAVSGSATVSARDSLEVTAPEGLTIVEMLVGQGQSVEAGDAVALLDLTEIQQKLAREAANLGKLQLDLEKLEKEEATDASASETAARNLSRAQDDYEAVRLQGKADIDAARKNLEEVLAKDEAEADDSSVETAQRNLQRAQDDFATGKARDDADVEAARNALSKAEKNKSDNVDATAVNNASRNLTRERESYNAVKAQGEKDVSDARAALDEALDAEDEEGAAIAQAALDAAIKKAADDLQTAKRRVEDAEATYAQAHNSYNNSLDQASNSRQTAIDNARNSLESAQRKAADNLLSNTRRVEDAQIALAQAELSYGKSALQTSDARAAEIENARNALETAENKAEDNLLSAARRVEDAQISLASAQRDYSRNTRQASETALQNSASAITLKLDIEDQKAVVDALEMLDLNAGVIYSDIQGVVMSAQPEGNVTGKNAVVSFMDGAKGFEARMQLSKADADKLSVGDECRVTTGGGSIYFTPTVTGTVTAMSLPDEQDKVQVVIRLPEGDWTDGQKVDVQVVMDRSTYDMCVPLSALRSDNTGYYLYIVEQKSTVLGVENVVARVPVTVVASDTESAAIQGPVSRNSQIITSSSKTVAADDRIRVNNG